MEPINNRNLVDIIRRFAPGSSLPSTLLLSEGPKGLSTYYAPFEHINPTARIVICGITPGLQQANKALQAASASLLRGTTWGEAIRVAKSTASFAGVMRTNIIAMLDHIGIQDVLGIKSCASLFAERSDLVHYTSALRCPVFKHGANYSGDKDMVNLDYLWKQSEQYLGEEIAQLSGAIWLPLGQSVVNVFEKMVARGHIAESQVLFGMPHASGANAERIQYFIAKKDRSALSIKVNPALIDERKRQLLEKVSSHSPSAIA